MHWPVVFPLHSIKSIGLSKISVSSFNLVVWFEVSWHVFPVGMNRAVSINSITFQGHQQRRRCVCIHTKYKLSAKSRMFCFLFLCKLQNNTFCQANFNLRLFPCVNVKFEDISRLTAVSAKMLEAPVNRLLFHVLFHAVLSLELHHPLVNCLMRFRGHGCQEGVVEKIYDLAKFPSPITLSITIVSVTKSHS